MAALAWLLIPLLAAIGAGSGAVGPARTRKARSDGPELDGYARFRAAMEKSAHVRHLTSARDAPRTAALTVR